MLKKINKNASGVPTGEYTNVAGGTLYADSPIATILPYGGATAPSGWFLCNGASLLRTSYPELFAVIGTAFGSADSTHFNIPDLRGEFLRGAGTNSHSGQGDGGSVGQHQNATAIPNVYKATGGGQVFVAPGTSALFQNEDASVAETSGSGYATISMSESLSTDIPSHYMTRPTNTSVNYIIKAKMVAVPADFMSAVDDAVGYVYQTSDVEGEYDANDFAVVGKTTRYCAKSPVHGYQVDGTAWWGFYETVCFRNGGYGYQTFRTMLGIPAMAIRQLYNGSWGNWQKLVTESDLTPTQITGIVKAEGNYTLNAYKSGKVVTVLFNANRSGTWTLNQQLATSGLPIPVGNAYHGLMMTTDGDAVGISVTGEGALAIGYPSSRTGWLFGCITYICQ